MSRKGSDLQVAGFNFNYHQAIRQANQVDAVASDMLQVAAKQLKPTLEAMAACWRGEASDQFLSYCTRAQTDLEAEATKLRDLAERIREVARVIRQAEERAREL